MKKITELTETRWRTVHLNDAYGNRFRDTEEYEAYREVKTVKQGPRFGHFIIDQICFRVILYTIFYAFAFIGFAASNNVEVSLTFSYIITLISLFLYPALYAFCEYTWQQTPGKFLTKTLVIDEYGNKPELRAIILRSLLRLVPFEPFSCYGDEYSYGWHDRWAKTWVVTKEELDEIKKLQIEQSEETMA